jgi:hypothetical protein
MAIIASVTDPDGRRVDLTDERWAHILYRHVELCDLQDEIFAAVQFPHSRYPGRLPGEEWFYAAGAGAGAGAGPSRWLRVVVISEEERGRIATAFPRRAKP